MTLRLLKMIRSDWFIFDGMMASQRVDPLALPPSRFLNLAYWYAVRQASEQEDIDRFDRRLWMPPKGVAPAPNSPWSPEAETNSFQALAAQVGATLGK